MVSVEGYSTDGISYKNFDAQRALVREVFQMRVFSSGEMFNQEGFLLWVCVLKGS